MGDFTSTFRSAHQAELDAAYRRGLQERNEQIAKLNARIGELEKDRANALQALVDALYDEKKRELIRIKMEEVYGVTPGMTVIITPEMDFLEDS